MLSQSLKKKEDGLRLGADHYFATSRPVNLRAAGRSFRPDRQHRQRQHRPRRLSRPARRRRHAGQRRRTRRAAERQRVLPHRGASLLRRLHDRRHRRDPGDAGLLRRARHRRRDRGHRSRLDQRGVRARAGHRRPLPLRHRYRHALSAAGSRLQPAPARAAAIPLPPPARGRARAEPSPCAPGGPGTHGNRGDRIGKMELQDFLDHVNRGAVIEGGSEAAPVHARRRAGRPADRRRAQHRVPHTRGGAGPADPTHRQGSGRVGHRLPAVLQRVRQEPDPRQGRLHQHRLPLPGHRGHHHRGRHAHRPRQHPDDSQPRRSTPTGAPT